MGEPLPKQLNGLKEQYPVTAHVPNFDFLTGCCEFKWCEESKRTYTKTSQHYRSRINFSCQVLIWQNRDFLVLPSLPLAGGWKEGKHFNASRRLISPASFHTSSDNSERNTQKWNSSSKDYVRKKPWRHGCDWGDLVELSFANHNVLQRCVSKLLNKPSYCWQN